jgi:hypothetical protein
MTPDELYQNWLRGTKILRPPKYLLATFGTTTLNYVLLSEMPHLQNQCRLREGKVTAQRPQILTPDLWKKRFEGFGDEAEAYQEMMDKTYGEAFRALEYTFKNQLESTSVEHASLQEVTDRALSRLNTQDTPRTALLQAPDATWGLSVMKFIVDLSLRSFPSNVRELHEHDMFEPEKRQAAKQQQEVERRFMQAARQPETIPQLAEYLKQAGVFGDYEDRFFALVNASRRSF